MYGAVQLALRRMHAGIPHDATACPEIADSDLAADHKAALLDLRHQLLAGPFTPDRLANDSGTRLRFLPVVRAVIERLESAVAPDWSGDLWDELTGVAKSLLTYMAKRESAELCDLADPVWGKNDTRLGLQAVKQALHKANDFLGRFGYHRVLRKRRGKPVIFWD